FRAMARARGAFANLRLHFEANQGQTDAAVKFLARGRSYTLFLTQTEAVLLAGARGATPALRMKLVGANPDVRVAGLERRRGTVNYLIGNDPSKWRTKVPTYARVKYERVYPGI